MKLHRVIAIARKSKGITLRALAEKTGISNACLSQMETGFVREPSFRNVVKLSRVLDTPLHKFAEAE